MSNYEDTKKLIDNLGDQSAFYNREQDDYLIRKAKSYLFFDDDTAIEFLASERFPNDPQAAMRYRNINGDLYYVDDSGELRKEFPDNAAVGAFEEAIVPNIVPAANFAADVYGGIAGMKKGLETGVKIVMNPANVWAKNPYAAGAVILGSTAAGGFAGNLIAGGGARLTREAIINQFYNAPPDELAAAIKDLGISSAFSAIPLGTGPTQRVINKFTNQDMALKYLVNLRSGADDIIQEAKTKFGIDLTPAEAAEIGNKGATIQHFLSRQPEITSINNFYSNRASQVREAIETYASAVGSGKPGDVSTRLADAGKKALDELTEKRRTRANRLYDYIKNSPEPIKVDNVQSIINKIDSKIAGEVLADDGTVIKTITPDPSTSANLQKFKKLFYKDGNVEGELIDDLASLDARRTSSMQDIINDVSGTGDFGIIVGLRNDLTSLMDEAEPIYKLARRVYDPTKPALQLVEKSAIGRLSKLVTDKQTATALKNVFDPNVSPQSLRNSRRILQAVDADLFQDVKKEFILQQLDRVTKETLDQGLPRFQQYFAQKNVQNMFKEMLSPEEYDNFYRLNNVLQRSFRVPRGSSDTQPFGVIAEELGRDSAGLGTKAINTLLSVTRLASRIFSDQGQDALTRGIAAQQREAYYQKLADILVDPDATKTIDEVYNYIGVKEPALMQSFMRGTAEGVEELTEPSEVPYQGDVNQKSFDQLKQEIEGFNVEPIDPGTQSNLSPVESISPTILPDEKDREIAMRRIGGIGSLV
jgi:hypothetical protein